MSPGEVLWRCRGKLQDAVDRILLPWRSKERPLHRFLVLHPDGQVTKPEVLGAHLGDRACRFATDHPSRWQQALTAQADRVVANRLSLFDLEDLYLGDQIDWNYEYKASVRAPTGPASTIDYRHYGVTGDCKFVWEPNRHHQLVVLGRAYRITGEQRYATAAVRQLESWIRQCPYGRGMNWRSPLELAIRLINWVWTFQLIGCSSTMTHGCRERFLRVVHRHLFEITRKYSRFSSANNHLIGEAAGVFIASSYFTGLKEALRWREQARQILLREILLQTHPDGGHREQATGYHLFVLEFLLLVGLVARNGGDELTPQFWERLERMFDFVAALSEGGSAPPMIGDADDGYVLDFGGRSAGAAPILSVGAVLFERSDLKSIAGELHEPVFWLLGQAGCRQFEQIESARGAQIRPRALPESGYYLLQRGHHREADRISVVFDCGQLGYLSIAAHGHADALSLILRVAGRDVLVDPGTYDYFTYGRWRNYFRSSAAHNTLVIDDTDQSEMLGSFLWGRKARCGNVRWEPTQGGGVVSAEHDGYTHVPDPVTHRRTVTFKDNAPELIVTDNVIAQGKHHVAIYWHFAEQCRLLPQEDNRFAVDFGAGVLTITMDSMLSVACTEGGENPIIGWVSRGYHRKSASTTLVGRCESDGPTSFTTRIVVDSSAGSKANRSE